MGLKRLLFFFEGALKRRLTILGRRLGLLDFGQRFGSFQSQRLLIALGELLVSDTPLMDKLFFPLQHLVVERQAGFFKLAFEALALFLDSGFLAINVLTHLDSHVIKSLLKLPFALYELRLILLAKLVFLAGP